MMKNNQMLPLCGRLFTLIHASATLVCIFISPQRLENIMTGLWFNFLFYGFDEFLVFLNLATTRYFIIFHRLITLETKQSTFVSNHHLPIINIVKGRLSYKNLDYLKLYTLQYIFHIINFRYMVNYIV